MDRHGCTQWLLLTVYDVWSESTMTGWKWGSLIGFIMLLEAVPVLAEETPNFGTLTLGADKTTGILRGTTGGTTSLPAIVNNVDRHNNKCIGFGDSNPDHIIILKQNFPTLKLQVSSGGDTTLVVQGPNGVVWCGDDASATNKDASLTDTDWPAGRYRVWVGSATQGGRRDYTLNVRQ